MSVGELRRQLRFEERRLKPDDGAGNREGNWVAQFITYARVRYLKGSEPVIAARLAGVQPVEITIRWNKDAVSVTPGWRAIDQETAEAFNIRSVANFDEKRKYMTLTAESGVPT